MLSSPTAAYTDLDAIYVALLVVVVLAPLMIRLGAARWPRLAVPVAARGFVLETRLTRPECVSQLRAHIGRKSLRNWSYRGPGFVDGIVASEGFVVHKHIRGRDSFLPVAAGVFHESSTGTTVHVRIGPFVALGLFIMLVLFAVFSAVFGYGAITTCGLCSIAPFEDFGPALILSGAIAGVMLWVFSKFLRARDLDELRATLAQALSAEA